MLEPLIDLNIPISNSRDPSAKITSLAVLSVAPCTYVSATHAKHGLPSDSSIYGLRQVRNKKHDENHFDRSVRRTVRPFSVRRNSRWPICPYLKYSLSFFMSVFNEILARLLAKCSFAFCSQLRWPYIRVGNCSDGVETNFNYVEINIVPENRNEYFDD